MSSPGWNLRNYLKDELSLSKAEVRKIMRTANRAALRSYKLTGKDLLTILGAFAFIGLFAFTFNLGLERLGIAFPGMLTSSIVGAFGGLVGGLLMSIRVRPFVFAELRRRGHNVCPKCGYLRAGLEDTQPCPECGATLNK